MNGDRHLGSRKATVNTRVCMKLNLNRFFIYNDRVSKCVHGDRSFTDHDISVSDSCPVVFVESKHAYIGHA